MYHSDAVLTEQQCALNLLGFFFLFVDKVFNCIRDLGEVANQLQTVSQRNIRTFASQIEICQVSSNLALVESKENECLKKSKHPSIVVQLSVKQRTCLDT